MDEPDLAALQNELAVVDMITKPQCKSSFGRIEVLLIKKEQIKLKMYQEKGHAYPHFHIDYGSFEHVASYAIDTGKRLDGDLHRKYDRVIGSWAEKNREPLLDCWEALQTGMSEQPFIKSLSALK